MEVGELWALLELARDANGKRDITGLLLHRQHCFFQVLEGDKEGVLDVFARIQADPRHKRVEILFEGEIDSREFIDWQMGFVQLDAIDASRIPGFSHYLEKHSEPRELFTELSKTQRLMMMFRDMV